MAYIDKNQIVKKSEDFDRWYTDVILKAELADYAPVKGCMVIRPYGYAIWEKVQAEFNAMIKDAGVENAYFPLFIPMSFLQKEKEHVEGFSPELAVVTVGGGEELAEPLVVRPTSETIMYDMYSKWVESWRDLPILINQWNNVIRWEKRTYLFLRTTEFLWQEGHTAHETQEQAEGFARRALDWYSTLYKDTFGMYPIAGTKSSTERFAGAQTTWTLEFLMPSGKALQGATSHSLGQNFAKAFDISFQNREGKNDFAWQTSWGLSTRSIGGLIMSHGDDQGLQMPPNIAPIQTVIVPIKSDESLISYCDEIGIELKEAGIRVRIDNREGKSMGWKFNEWELKGVPVRIEIGTREMEAGMLTVYRRDTFEKKQVKRSEVLSYIKDLLAEIQTSMYNANKSFVEAHTYVVDSYDHFKQIMSGEKGFIRAFWCESSECEKKIKDETKATTRCLPLVAQKEDGKCVYCGKACDYRWYFAQAY